MLKIFKYFKLKEWLFILLSALLIVGEVFCELKLPDYMNTITTLVETNGSTSEVLKNGGFMVFLHF